MPDELTLLPQPAHLIGDGDRVWCPIRCCKREATAASLELRIRFFDGGRWGGGLAREVFKMLLAPSSAGTDSAPPGAGADCTLAGQLARVWRPSATSARRRRST